MNRASFCSNDDCTALRAVSSHNQHGRGSVIQLNKKKSSVLKVKKTSGLPGRPYYRCLDVDRQRAQLQTIRRRVWESHVVKAYEVTALSDQANIEQKQKDGAKKEEESGVFQFPSEVFDDPDANTADRGKPWKPKGTKRSGKTDAEKSIAARKLGLAKADEFTGTEAYALKKLLKSLHTKTWDPELYFHIRFFSIRNTIQALSQEAKLLAKQRWHFLLKMLSKMAKIESVLAERSYKKAESCCTYMDIVESCIQPILWGHDRSLTFDKDAYKVHANTMLSLDARKVLRDLPPEERSPQQIQQTVLSLQYVTAFARLPTPIQHRLVQEGHYMRVGSKRVILQQGHVPQNYYFVLLGQAVSKRFLYPSGKTETTAILRKGDGFGSVAIFDRCRRLTTVVSQTPLHLFVIPKKTFLEQFGKDVPDPVANTITFLSKMWFMEHWPIEYLWKCPHQCKVKQFRRTEIVEEDAAKSRWIYSVTKGCSVNIFEKEQNKPKTMSLNGVCRVYQKVYDPIPFHMALKAMFASGLNLSEVPPFSGEMSCSKSQLLKSRRSTCRQSRFSEMSVPNYQYKLVQTLRHLDVFGLEDMPLDCRQPPPPRSLLLISDDVEFVMLSKSFYLRLSGQQLRRKVHSRLTARKLTYKQVTTKDCSLIPIGGIRKDPKLLVDPIQSSFCIHC